ncbi:MAG: hypothetical protein JJE52_12030 [Acidimicrobiia bacterium]|nr:hypothetical protein [Acidimicrobiia bacterium]
MRSGRPLGEDDSPLLDETVRLAIPVVLVVSIYLLFAGHNAPGGGFIGGLVASAAVFLRYIAGGVPSRRGLMRLPFEVLLGVGLLISVAAGLSSLLLGDAFLEAWLVDLDVAMLGRVKFTASLPFDLGVYLVVLGLGVAIVDSLGREADDDSDTAVESGEAP